MDPNVKDVVDKVVEEYKVTDDFLRQATAKFIKCMDEGLAAKKPSREHLPMIPTFVTDIPTGKEKGLFLAGDLGGTNFRVCSIELNGDHTFELKQSKFKIPLELMSGSSADELFSYLAGKIYSFLKEHHGDRDLQNVEKLKLGFTFSFPVDQTALNRGKLIRWTKGFDLPDCVDKDVVELLQTHLDLLKVNVHVAALANDTVGTLLSRAYSNNPKITNSNTIVGAIFGTGTNGAYYETFDKITKFDGHQIDSSKKGMVINTEWGSFDNSLEVLPNTKYDQIIDLETSNVGYHLFEKRISGMFLGELLRVTLIELFNSGIIFTELFESRGGSLPHRLAEPWQLDAEVLSYLQIDDSTDLKMSELILQNHLRLPTTKQERLVIQALTHAISHRAAYLSAIPLAAITKRVAVHYEDDSRDFEFGLDGSVVEFYPGFKENILKAIDIIDPLKGSTKKIHLKIAKDGSGVGAALCASTA